MLWLWHRSEATVPIRPLAWEHPYATRAALEKMKTNKQTKKLKAQHNERNMCMIQCPQITNRKLLSGKVETVTVCVSLICIDFGGH